MSIRNLGFSKIMLISLLAPLLVLAALATSLSFKISDLEQVLSDSLDMGRFQRMNGLVDMYHDGLRGRAFQALYYHTTDNPGAVELARSGLEEDAANMRETLANAQAMLGKMGIEFNDLKGDVNRYITLVQRAADNPGDPAQLLGNIYDQFMILEEALAERSQNTQAVFEERVLQERQSIEAALELLGLVAILVLVVTLVMAVWLYRRLRSQLGDEPEALVAATREIAQGNYEVTLATAARAESVTGAIAAMLESLRKSREQAVFNAQIKAAMDAASVNVMIADNDRNIVYLNRSVERMLRTDEKEFQKQVPNFRADKVLNENIDQFHKNPAHQKGLLENLTSSHVGDIQVGEKQFRLSVNPVIGPDGERLGSMIEWLDRTVEVKAGKEIAELVTGAVQGDFSRRVAVEGKEGFFLTIAEGLNELVETAEKGLNDVVRVLGDMAGGDMTQRITADYEGTFGKLKDYSNETAENLSQMLGEIRTATESIATASQEISQGNTDLSSRTEEQASNLEETASSMEELTSTVKQNTDNARQANSLSDQATEVAQAGGELIGRVVATMNDINESAQKIEEIIGVIDSIAFQTNILALNAAVEAARAGDQGRGFAVVASEVRSLAQRSANAAKDIKGLIGESVSKIQSGNALVNESGGKTDEIVTSIKRVSDINSEISAASEEQSSGIENVNTAVSQLDEMTQQNAALVEQAAAAAESQLSQVETLQQLVGKFRILEDQGQGGMAQAPRLEASRSAGKSQAPARKAPSAPRDLPQSDDDDWDTF